MHRGRRRDRFSPTPSVFFQPARRGLDAPRRMRASRRYLQHASTVEDSKAAYAYFFFFRFVFFAAFFLLFAMLPSWYQVATSLQCSRESTCTAIGLLQPDEKNSDLQPSKPFLMSHVN